MVGGLSPAAMKRAARFDGWMATTHEEKDIYPLLDSLRGIREEDGSADKPFDIWTGVINPDDGTHERLAEAGITMVNGTNFLGADGKTTVSRIDDKKQRIEAFANKFIHKK